MDQLASSSGEVRGMELPNDDILGDACGRGIPFSEVLAFLSLHEVVTLLTAVRKVVKPRFILSPGHKRELLALALPESPLVGPFPRENMMIGVVEVQRSLTIDALPQFAAFIKAMPAELTRAELYDLDWMRDGDWMAVTGVSSVQRTLTCHHGASNIRVCIPCSVCANGAPYPCGTIVLAQCPACLNVRDECAVDSAVCKSCKHKVCRKCVFQLSASGHMLCSNCSFQCSGCVTRSWGHGSTCNGVADDHPCPFDHRHRPNP